MENEKTWIADPNSNIIYLKRAEDVLNNKMNTAGRLTIKDIREALGYVAPGMAYSDRIVYDKDHDFYEEF